MRLNISSLNGRSIDKIERNSWQGLLEIVNILDVCQRFLEFSSSLSLRWAHARCGDVMSPERIAWRACATKIERSMVRCESFLTIAGSSQAPKENSLNLYVEDFGTCENPTYKKFF
jgi:hypothetical protein